MRVLIINLVRKFSVLKQTIKVYNTFILVTSLGGYFRRPCSSIYYGVSRRGKEEIYGEYYNHLPVRSGTGFSFLFQVKANHSEMQYKNYKDQCR